MADFFLTPSSHQGAPGGVHGLYFILIPNPVVGLKPKTLKNFWFLFSNFHRVWCKGEMKNTSNALRHSPPSSVQQSGLFILIKDPCKMEESFELCEVVCSMPKWLAEGHPLEFHGRREI